MTAITLSQVNAAADLFNAGKSAWLTIADDAVQGVYSSRGAARDAKNGKPVKHADLEANQLVLVDGATDLPTGEAIADAMLEDTPEADVGYGDKLEEDDAAEFAAAKADEIATPEVVVTPIDPAKEVKTAKEPKVLIHKSEPLRPTKLVWAVADQMVAEAEEAGLPAPTRKQVLDRCEAMGIAFFTARTQYQVWKSMQA